MPAVPKKRLSRARRLGTDPRRGWLRRAAALRARLLAPCRLNQSDVGSYWLSLRPVTFDAVAESFARSARTRAGVFW